MTDLNRLTGIDVCLLYFTESKFLRVMEMVFTSLEVPEDYYHLTFYLVGVDYFRCRV